MTKRLNKTQIADRRRKAGDWALEGWSQERIAAALEVSQATVCRDLEVKRREWREASLRDFNELRAEQLHKLDLVEAEAWAAWRRSQQPVRSASITETDKGTKKVSSLKHGHGDRRFLDEIRKCVADRCELVGLEPPPRPAPPPEPEPKLPEDILNVSILENFEPEQLFEIISHAIQCAKEARARREEYARERAAKDHDAPPRPATASHPLGFSRPTPPAAPHGGFSSHLDEAALHQILPSPAGGDGALREPGESRKERVERPLEDSGSVTSDPALPSAFSNQLPREAPLTPDPSPAGGEGNRIVVAPGHKAGPPESATIPGTTTDRVDEPGKPKRPAETGGHDWPAEWDSPRITVVRDDIPRPIPTGPPPELPSSHFFEDD